MILPNLQVHLPTAIHQHGFRQKRSTTTALNCIIHQFSTGLSKAEHCERTVLIALDLRAAFDTFNLSSLFSDIPATTIPVHIKRWLTYLQGRSMTVEFRGKLSRLRKIGMGVSRSISRSVISYAAPAWSSLVSKDFQRKQNTALRTITGSLWCHKKVTSTTIRRFYQWRYTTNSSVIKSTWVPASQKEQNTTRRLSPARDLET